MTALAINFDHLQKSMTEADALLPPALAPMVARFSCLLSPLTILCKELT
jgi:hypothetical protein